MTWKVGLACTIVICSCLCCYTVEINGLSGFKLELIFSISPYTPEALMAAHPASWSDAAEEHRAGKPHSVCPTETRGCPRSERQGNHSHSDRQYEPPLQLVRRISAGPGERWLDLALLHLPPQMLLRSWSMTKGHKRVKSLQGECRSLRPLQDSVLRRNISPEPSVSPDIPKRKQKTEKVGNYDCL